MFSVRRALLLRLIPALLLLSVRALAQSTPPAMMPAPLLLPDPGARCAGWLLCPTIGQAELTIVLHPWYASPVPGVRDEAGGLHAALDLDLSKHFEAGLSAGMLTWLSTGTPPVRTLGWNLVGAHLRGAVALGALSLVGDYSQQWALGNAGYGLLQPGGSLGRGSAGAYLSLLDGGISLGSVGAVAYAPQSGAAAAEAGVRAAVVPPDPDHHVTLYLEGGAREGVRGPGGTWGGWASVGFSGVSREGGTEMGGGILVGKGDGVPLILISMRLGEHLGHGYTPFRLRSPEPDPDEPPPPPAGGLPAPPVPLPPGWPPLWSPPWPPGAPPPSCAELPCLGVRSGLALPPGRWFPPGVQEAWPAPPGPHAPKGTMTAYLDRMKRHRWGQMAEPPSRPPMPRTGWQSGRGAEPGSPYEGEREGKGEWSEPWDAINRAQKRELRRRTAEAARGDDEPRPPSAVPVLRPARGAPPLPEPDIPPPDAAEQVRAWAEAMRHYRDGTHPPEVAPRREPEPQQKPGRPAKAEFTRSQKETTFELTRDPRDGEHKCEECGSTQVRAEPDRPGVRPPDNRATINHLIPVAKGGTRSPGNPSGECAGCNGDQSDRYVKSWTMNPVDPRMPFGPAAQRRAQVNSRKRK